MKNSFGFFIILISYTLFFLKIYTPWPYICLVTIGLIVSNKNYITRNNAENK